MPERDSLFACVVVRADGTLDSPRFIRAEDVESAVREYASTRSVALLRTGAVVAAWRLGRFPVSYHVQYDGDPMNRQTKVAVHVLGNVPLPEART